MDDLTPEFFERLRAFIHDVNSVLSDIYNHKEHDNTILLISHRTGIEPFHVLGIITILLINKQISGRCKGVHFHCQKYVLYL